MSLKLKWIFTLTILFFSVAEAATYTLPSGTLPNSCASDGSNTVICSSLILNWNDKINVTASGAVTLNINGDAYFSNVKINVGGDHNNLTINIDGKLTSNTQEVVVANIYAIGPITTSDNSNYTGNLNSENSITSSTGTKITGDIFSPSAIIGGKNTLNGNVNATNITIQASNSVVNGYLSASNSIDLGSHASITGNISAGGHITTTSPVTLAGDISAGGDFNLASGSTVLGNIDADNITMAPSSSTVTGELSAVNKVILGSGNTVVGDVYGKTITLESSIGRIEGNATATDLVTINWHGVITGDVTAPHIENNGGTIIGDIFCDTRNGLVRECNTPEGGNDGDLGGGLASCTGFNEMIGSGVIGGTNGNPTFSYDSGSTINGLPITGSGGNSPTPNGQVAVVPTNFPSLDPEVFPSNSNFGGPGQKNIQGISPGSYGTLRTSENGSTSTSGGGTYYINKLSLEEESSITLGSGNYFIKAVELKEKSEIIIAPGAKVRIFIAPDGKFEVDEKVEINKFGEVS